MPSALPDAVYSSSRPLRSFALTMQPSASSKFHAFKALSPTMRHLASAPLSSASWYAMSRWFSCTARSKRCSASVVTSSANSFMSSASRKRAILGRCSPGIDGSSSAAASRSPRRIAVWYSITGSGRT
ncbi:hypothetical protein FBU59_004379 [Linderina macrospora]|uniref:Uncharacterized protein n=1 Tax=Linderina macrospora TaxID=4868 RepID=A0ACC1J5W4_9FUNG|nr:hypothetical protein FBU59_004379 [Linderina macrospora]